MKRVSAKKSLPFECGQLLDLAADVGNYPKFLPWVKAVRIWNKNGDGSQFDAELMIGYQNFRVPFSTHVTIDKVNNKIFTQNLKSKPKGLFSLGSPIKNLVCVWGFEPKENQTEISVAIELEFNDLIIGSLVGSNLDKATNRLISNFTDEAHARFGNSLQGA